MRQLESQRNIGASAREFGLEKHQVFVVPEKKAEGALPEARQALVGLYSSLPPPLLQFLW